VEKVENKKRKIEWLWEADRFVTVRRGAAFLKGERGGVNG
jgi:hypothetical protein